jgi:hypothetical protein
MFLAVFDGNNKKWSKFSTSVFLSNKLIDIGQLLTNLRFVQGIFIAGCHNEGLLSNAEYIKVLILAFAAFDYILVLVIRGFFEFKDSVRLIFKAFVPKYSSSQSITAVENSTFSET